MSDNDDEKLKINHEIYTEEEQHNFLLSNLSEQFRPYYIARGSTTANYYSDWNEEMTNEPSKQLKIDLEGKHDNGYILDAYNMYGEEYRTYQTQAKNS